jgi:Protein of unknown function (DUF3349)
VAITGLLQRVLDWLHAGYPEGVPKQDYYPLLAFLSRSLKPDEVSEVVTALQKDLQPGEQTSTADVQAAIETITKSPALVQDVRRVEDKLRNTGWELEPVAER